MFFKAREWKAENVFGNSNFSKRFCQGGDRIVCNKQTLRIEVLINISKTTVRVDRICYPSRRIRS